MIGIMTGTFFYLLGLMMILKDHTETSRVSRRPIPAMRTETPKGLTPLHKVFYFINNRVFFSEYPACMTLEPISSRGLPLDISGDSLELIYAPF